MTPASITQLLLEGVLDAPLAALVWLLAEARVPVLVGGAAELREERGAMRDALTDLAAPQLRRVRIDATGNGLQGLTAADAGSTILVGVDVTAEPTPALQVPFKALARGGDLVASVEGDSLEDVFARLRRLDLRLTDDELSFVGLVLVVRRVAVAGAPAIRVVAAHYVRPLARDPSGHVQRMGPAVLATWDQGGDAFEDFSWGITADLAGRAEIRPGDLDHEVEHRAAYLAGLVAGGVRTAAEVRTALEGFRHAHDAPGAH